MQLPSYSKEWQKIFWLNNRLYEIRTDSLELSRVQEKENELSWMRLDSNYWILEKLKNTSSSCF